MISQCHIERNSRCIATDMRRATESFRLSVLRGFSKAVVYMKCVHTTLRPTTDRPSAFHLQLKLTLTQLNKT